MMVRSGSPNVNKVDQILDILFYNIPAELNLNYIKQL